MREVKENLKWMKGQFAEKAAGLGLGSESGDKKEHHHHRIPSINTHCDPDDKDHESAIDSIAVLDTPQSGRSSRHGSSASAKSLSRYEPRVLHGWTLTPDVGFRDVCIAVRETAFVNSKLPIIVSLEVHADYEQQELMVDIMKEEWGKLLVDEKHPMCNPEERLPRLDELFNRILVKVKKATQTPQKNGAPIVPPNKDAKIGVNSNAMKSNPSLATASTSSTLSPMPTTNSMLAPRTASDDRDPERNGRPESDDEEIYRSRSRSRKSKESKAPKKTGICENLSNLGIYTHSEHFESFEAAASSRPSHVFSIAEGDIEELHGRERAMMFQHNQKFFLRAYPSGRRIDSSNPDPSIFWRKGVQMVALNWQSWDEGTMINEGMFGPSRSGWIRKPAGYLSDTSPSNIVKRQILDFRLTILAGQDVPLPPKEKKEKGFHPYIKCELHVDKHEEIDGVSPAAQAKTSGGKIEGTYKLSTHCAKGANPDWGQGECLRYEGIPGVIEELSFVRYFDLLFLFIFLFPSFFRHFRY